MLTLRHIELVQAFCYAHTQPLLQPRVGAAHLLSAGLPSDLTHPSWRIPILCVQLTDEAHGDNPAESATRDEKKITESDFYTKA